MTADDKYSLFSIFTCNALNNKMNVGINVGTIFLKSSRFSR